MSDIDQDEHTSKSTQIVIAGRGKVGRGIFRALRPTPLRARIVQGRTMGRRQVAGADLLVLAVPDDAISSCAHRVAPHLSRSTAVVHCAGMRGLDVLDAFRARGIPVAVMHPQASFADAKRPPSLEGTTLVTHGDPKAVRAVRRMAKAMGARVVVADVHGPSYHAAAVLAANAAAALATSAVDVLRTIGMGHTEAQRAIAGLLHTVAHNVEHVGVPQALTGPVARGDGPTVRAHRQALTQLRGKALETYERVAPVIVDAAVAAGLPPARARAIRRALSADVTPRR